MARNGASALGGTRASGQRSSQSETRPDVILVPSSPDLPPMPASAAMLSSMPPPATPTPHTSKFSMQAFSFSSSPSLPSRTIEPPSDERIASRNAPVSQAAQRREYVTLDSTPDVAARTVPPPGATRSIFFNGGETSSSQSADNNQDKTTVRSTDKETAATAPRPERYEASDLVQAVERRRDWTPPPGDTVLLPGTSSSPPMEKWSSPRETAPTAARSDIFKTLHNSFSCKEASPAPTVPSEPLLAKRKPIEAVSIGTAGTGSTGSKGSSKSPTKAAPKKKPRTLTELAMAAYADSPVAEEEDVAVSETAAPKKRGRPKRQLEVVEENGGEPLPTQPAVVRPGFPTTKLRKLQSAAAATTTPDGKKVKKPRKKPAPRTKKQVVLSPESARAESMRQDFLFGTSSQLAADESPTFLRQLHAAMQESNGPHDEDSHEDRNPLMDLFDDASEIDLTAAKSVTTRSGPKTKLWGAAWRGEDGQVTVEHVIDLEGDEAAAFPEDPHQVLAMAQRAAEQQAQGVVEDADEIDLTGAASRKATKAVTETETEAKTEAKTASHTRPVQSVQSVQPTPAPLPWKPVAGARKMLPDTPSPTKARAQTEAQTHIPSPSQSALIELMSPPRPSTASAPATAPAPAPAPATEAAIPTRPNFDVLSTIQLSSKVASYGYKPMRVRSAMVALLNQCWDAKNGIQAGAVQTASISTSSVAAAPAVKATAKAKKAPAKSTAKASSPRTKTAKTTKTTKTTKASAKASETTSPSRVTKPKKAPLKKATTKKATAAEHQQRKQSPSERDVFEIEDSEASDSGRFSSPEVPCSVASDASLAYDSDGMADETDVVGELDDELDDELDADETLAGEPTCEETRLFALITEAVTVAPSSTNPVQPSWHEKMLMYDTIILEEFTEWVNSALGEANEVTALQAKKWCESKSVCCTWRKNTRGKERKL